MDTVKEQIINIIAKYFEINHTLINENSELDHDIGCDSLDIVELTMEIEENLGIEINDEHMTELKTVGDLIRVAEKLKEGKL